MTLKSTTAARKSVRGPGRPSSYTSKVGADICRRIAEGESLSHICADPRMPDVRTVLRWAGSDVEGFRQLYARAMEARAHLLAEEILELADAADPENVQAQKLKVDTRKWVASKFWPRVFGDRIQTDVQQLDRNGSPTDPAAVNVMVLAADKLDTDELRVLVALYRKMGIRLPHEPEPSGAGPLTIEHDGDEDD